MDRRGRAGAVTIRGNNAAYGGPPNAESTAVRVTVVTAQTVRNKFHEGGMRGGVCSQRSTCSSMGFSMGAEGPLLVSRSVHK